MFAPDFKGVEGPGEPGRMQLSKRLGLGNCLEAFPLLNGGSRHVAGRCPSRSLMAW